MTIFFRDYVLIAMTKRSGGDIKLDQYIDLSGGNPSHLYKVAPSTRVAWIVVTTSSVSDPNLNVKRVENITARIYHQSVRRYQAQS